MYGMMNFQKIVYDNIWHNQTICDPINNAVDLSVHMVYDTKLLTQNIMNDGIQYKEIILNEAKSILYRINAINIVTDDLCFAQNSKILTENDMEAKFILDEAENILQNMKDITRISSINIFNDFAEASRIVNDAKIVRENLTNRALKYKKRLMDDADNILKNIKKRSRITSMNIWNKLAKRKQKAMSWKEQMMIILSVQAGIGLLVELQT
jgi:cell division septum initiation protein DivIVA